MRRVGSPADLESESFDFINSEQVFEHLVEPRQALASLSRALRCGGLLRISVPNGSDVDARLKLEDRSAPRGPPPRSTVWHLWSI